MQERQTKDLKVCTKCGESKPLSEFYKSTKDGYQYYCKSCKLIYDKQYRIDNADRIAQYQREYMQQFEGKYIYTVHDLTGEVVYVGSTVNIKNRSNQHIYCTSNISDYMSQNKWLCIRYVKLSDNINKQELKWIEQQFIKEYNPVLNIMPAIVNYDFIDGDRLAYLMVLSYDLIDSYDDEASIWKVNKYIN